ncbi:MAG: NfeD family protein [Pegethrix bostrychoides GSE-TBD4-15B]|jgi:membrane protein implicated in regulation of membrane protease activity|uniref:NfeD family protein n=1 Tax=Pegethrix bostrychoides GSE-TBD4-15B TaxID=2839662 RepID=A0A951U5K3_9CYAN|nr:NfeD family protein [Pegethrix bostrychoides GSE-TBD4-15B]
MYKLPNKPIDRPIELFSSPHEGIIDRPIVAHQPGRVKAMGSIWNARFYQIERQIVIAVGDRVLIVGRQGLTLLIVPML